MAKVSIENDLISAIDFLEGAFLPGELSYLLVTSKSELLLRDRMAFHLYNLYKEKGLSFKVAREWKRFDLGILSDELPVALVEAKLFYYFDLLKDNINGIGYVKRAIAKDADKLKSEKNRGITSTYNLLFCTKLSGIPNLNYKDTIKYFNTYQRYTKNYFDFKSSNSKIKYFFPKPNYDLRYSKEIICGNAYGLDVNLEVFLLKT